MGLVCLRLPVCFDRLFVDRSEEVGTEAWHVVQVFALWVATGPQQTDVTGVHVFSFDGNGKIDSVAAFREPFPRERRAHLRSVP